MYSQANAYKKNQITTTSSANLVLMLYDGARKYIRKAVCAMDNQDIQGVNHNLQRAQDIMSELMCGINFGAGEIAESLYSLYEYMRHRLIEVNVKKDRVAAEEVLGMVDELRGAWAQIMKSGSVKATRDDGEKNLRIS